MRLATPRAEVLAPMLTPQLDLRFRPAPAVVVVVVVVVIVVVVAVVVGPASSSVPGVPESAPASDILVV